MKAALTTIAITALAILAGWLLIRLAENMEARMKAKQVAGKTTPAPVTDEPVGVTTD